MLARKSTSRLGAFTLPAVFGLICSFHTLPIHGQVPWPGDGQWQPVLRNGQILQDDNSDARGSRNVVSAPEHPSAYLFNDGTRLFFRLRLDDSPAGKGGQGMLEPFGWGMQIDTDLDLNDYEWLVMVDGIAKTENVALEHNTEQAAAGDPSDPAEVVAATYTPIAGYLRIREADTSINGDRDYFLDWWIPYGDLKAVSGLTDTSPIRVVWGTSSNARALSVGGGDLVGGSDLFSAASDISLPLGTAAATGTVRFVAGPAHGGEISTIVPGDTLFVEVIDADQNWDPATVQTVSVVLTSGAGERETLLLTETGTDTGAFAGSAATVEGEPASDGVVQARNSVTAVYTDAVDASGNIGHLRTDVVTVTSANNPPVAWPDSVTTFVDTSVTVSVLANDSDPDGDVLAISAVTQPLHGTATITGDTQILYTPEPGYAGHDSLRYTITDGSGDHAESTLAVTVVPLFAPEISLSKQVDKETASPGDTLEYAATYLNSGNDTATELVITESIPALTTYVPDSVVLNGQPCTDAADDDRVVVADGVITVRIGAVAAGQSGVVRYRVTVR